MFDPRYHAFNTVIGINMLKNSKLFFAFTVAFLSMGVNSFCMKISSRPKMMKWKKTFHVSRAEDAGTAPLVEKKKPVFAEELPDGLSLQIYLKRTISEDALVIFNCDEVLLVPKNNINLVENRTYLNSALDLINNELEDQETLRKTHEYIEKGFQEFVPLNRSVIDMVKNLQEQKITTMVLTSYHIGDRGNGETWEDYRSNNLKEHGFHFENSWPAEMNGPLMNGNETAWSFKDGVLFTNGHPEGDTLISFFQHFGYTSENFSRIIMIDDEYDNLISVSRACIQLGIAFSGGYYTEKRDLFLTKEVVTDEVISIAEDFLEGCLI